MIPHGSAEQFATGILSNPGCNQAIPTDGPEQRTEGRRKVQWSATRAILTTHLVHHQLTKGENDGTFAN